MAESVREIYEKLHVNALAPVSDEFATPKTKLLRNQVAKRARRVALQERARHALHDRVNGLRACRDVRLVLRRLRRELRGLLLALRGRIRDGRLGILAVLLVLDLRCLILKIPLEGNGGNGGEGIIFQATNLPSHFPSMICKCFQTQMC